MTTRSSRGIANLNEVLEHPKIQRAAGIKVTVVSLGEGNYTTSEAQMSLFLEADIYVAAHGKSPSGPGAPFGGGHGGFRGPAIISNIVGGTLMSLSFRRSLVGARRSSSQITDHRSQITEAAVLGSGWTTYWPYLCRCPVRMLTALL